ncbi:hypothetical protein ACFL4N_07165, partial [Thermodesulfobacteriota bacterium]
VWKDSEKLFSNIPIIQHSITPSQYEKKVTVRVIVSDLALKTRFYGQNKCGTSLSFRARIASFSGLAQLRPFAHRRDVVYQKKGLFTTVI